MKICILSMQMVNNYGSLLQAYSLKKILEELGHSVSFLNIENNDNENRLLATASHNNYLSEIERTLKINKYIGNKLILRFKESFLYKKFNLFRSQYLGIKGFENNYQYDICVIGSDEVFNCLQHAPWGFTSQLFGNVPQASRVITYAACCGATTYDQIPKDIKPIIKSSLEKLCGISVRDNNTSEFVKRFVGVTPEIDLDPVAIGNFDEEIASVGCFTNSLPKHYCIVYLYQNRIKDEDDIKHIMNFCAERKLAIVSIGEIQKWNMKHLFVNPFEALCAFKNADFIITDTFHGTIFGAKYSHKLAIMIRESNRNKLADLIKRLGIEEHIAKDINDLERVYNLNLDRNHIDKLLADEREKSLRYLKNNCSFK